jgi:hypothetical protein
MPLLEAVHPQFELTSPESSSESSVPLSIFEDSPPSEPRHEPLTSPEDSEDEGGIAGAMDSTDDD